MRSNDGHEEPKDDFKKALTKVTTGTPADLLKLLPQATSIPDRDDRAEALKLLSDSLCSLSSFREAESVAAQMPVTAERGKALLLIARRYLEAKDLDSGSRVLRQMEELASNTTTPGEIDPWQKAELLHEAGVLATQASQKDLALSFLELGVRYAKEGEGSASQQEAADSTSVLVDLVDALIKSGNAKTAKHVATEIRNLSRRARALAFFDSLASDNTR